MSEAMDLYARIAHDPQLSDLVEALQRLCRREHRRLADACVALQRSVTEFRTADECAAYNLALRDVAALLGEGRL